jgi:hypothetical protein
VLPILCPYFLRSLAKTLEAGLHPLSFYLLHEQTTFRPRRNILAFIPPLSRPKIETIKNAPRSHPAPQPSLHRQASSTLPPPPIHDPFLAPPTPHTTAQVPRLHPHRIRQLPLSLFLSIKPSPLLRTPAFKPPSMDLALPPLLHHLPPRHNAALLIGRPLFLLQPASASAIPFVVARSIAHYADFTDEVDRAATAG